VAKRRDHRSPSSSSPNRQLRDEGWLPIKWAGTISRFKELGIEVKDRPDIFTKPGDRPGATTGGEAGSLWGPRWAVLVAEAEPCNEDARDWALARGALDEEFRDGLMTVALFGDRSRMATYVMEVWQP
jgi:hypothetical protein